MRELSLTGRSPSAPSPAPTSSCSGWMSRGRWWTACSASRSSASTTPRASATTSTTPCSSRPTTRGRARPLVAAQPDAGVPLGRLHRQAGPHLQLHGDRDVRHAGEARARPVGRRCRSTTEDPDDGTHGVYFNRGVVASQAYQQRFGTVAPSKVPNGEAYKWLSRGLEEALVAFIGQAVGTALRAARGDLRVQRIRRCSRRSRSRPRPAPTSRSSSRGAEERATTRRAEPGRDREAGIGALCTPRTKTTIAHNKFIVLLHDGKPLQVWTGSTNITEGGIFGHANVGHRITRPGGRPALPRVLDAARRRPDRRTTARPSTTRCRRPRPAAAPRTRRRSSARARARRRSSGTAGSPNRQERRLPHRGLRAHGRDRAGLRRARKLPALPAARPRDRQRQDGPARPVNVVAAGGFKAKGGWRQWIAKGLTNLNGHVDYVHTKFMLVDPLGDDPLVITGSANWSDESIKRQRREHARDPRRHARRRHLPRRSSCACSTTTACAASAKPGPTELEPGPGATATERGKLHLRDDDSWAAPFFVPGSPEAKERLLFA